MQNKRRFTVWLVRREGVLRFTRVTIAGQSRGKRRGVGVVKKTTQHDVFCILLAALCWTAPHQLSYSRQQSNIAKTARRRREWRQYVTALNNRPTSTMAVDLFFSSSLTALPNDSCKAIYSSDAIATWLVYANPFFLSFPIDGGDQKKKIAILLFFHSRKETSIIRFLFSYFLLCIFFKRRRHSHFPILFVSLFLAVLPWKQEELSCTCSKLREREGKGDERKMKYVRTCEIPAGVARIRSARMHSTSDMQFSKAHGSCFFPSFLPSSSW